MAIYKTKLRAVGKSTGLIIPKEMLEALHLKQGDTVCFRQSNEEFVLTAGDPEVERQIAAARKGISKFRNTLKALAE